ncbi:DUF485 domain-containing protein [Cellulomonas sp. zg-ZUI222]|uniref:DUF485 domain-containing protein n=1 Tax=Cellulomonas wangleii TaxID=2816956 RepID=A0ABX8D062_9CELL|nr:MULTISPECIES: DUF485 domain-containing protein [Cellulomonas]MBO0900234.1 DUF485 domain-containing protein [Cellulomonas sp. zg-ZUI22]MBO0920852.1 DUF485 domain-containing protein [Cellulomonas wangleii]MBO0926552.1 DUF485 domain-containing protein [Cellulomonas wangleii]QVI60883.1 DUF485 domain-containing protein [Cellulomonas wangleii]
MSQSQTETDYQRVQRSPEFQDLRRRFRNFVFPMTALFLAWYFLYVLLANYAHAFMSQRVVGTITVGLLLGLGQFVSTFAITMAYARWANQKQDAVAENLREHIESGALIDGAAPARPADGSRA